MLPKVFEDHSYDEIDLIFSDDELKNGGAALMAYCKMQFTHMSDIEKEALKSALLKYCELDTLGMVLLIEGWQDLLLN